MQLSSLRGEICILRKTAHQHSSKARGSATFSFTPAELPVEAFGGQASGDSYVRGRLRGRGRRGLVGFWGIPICPPCSVDCACPTSPEDVDNYSNPVVLISGKLMETPRFADPNPWSSGSYLAHQQSSGTAAGLWPYSDFACVIEGTRLICHERKTERNSIVIEVVLPDSRPICLRSLLYEAVLIEVTLPELDVENTTGYAGVDHQKPFLRCFHRIA